MGLGDYWRTFTDDPAGWLRAFGVNYAGEVKETYVAPITNATGQAYEWGSLYAWNLGQEYKELGSGISDAAGTIWDKMKNAWWWYRLFAIIAGVAIILFLLLPYAGTINGVASSVLPSGKKGK